MSKILRFERERSDIEGFLGNEDDAQVGKVDMANRLQLAF